MTLTLSSHDSHLPDDMMATIWQPHTMNMPFNNNGASDWGTNVEDSSAFGSTGFGMTNLPPSTTYLENSTPKTQLSENGWSQLNALNQNQNGDWSLHPGMTPTREAPWSANDVSLLKGSTNANHNSEVGVRSPIQSHPVAPMPIPERSVTEPLWQRRLNAKNRELEQLHNRTSTPEIPQVGAVIESPTTSEHSEIAHVNQRDLTWSQSSLTNGLDNDYTHASPNTLRMLSLKSHSLPTNNAQNAVDPSSVSRPMRHPTMHEKANQPSANSFSGAPSERLLAAMHHAGMDYPSQLSYLQSLSNDGHLTRDDLQHSSSMPDSHADQTQMDSTSPTLYGRSLQSGDVYGDYSSGTRVNERDVHGAIPFNRFLPPSPKNGSANGKGVINKVIVPSAPGVPTDAVDLRTGEAGQMRHMCPHPGCDKHFSTSGHARRHSRIHDCLRPFECPHEGCHATFTRRDNCTQHQRARHKFQLVAHRICDEE